MKILILLTIFVLSACSSQKSFNNGAYSDPRKINLLNDKFSETDAQVLSQKLSSQIKDCYIAKNLKRPPNVAIHKIKNLTSEMIELDMITNALSHSLYTSGNFKFVNKKARLDLEEEYNYENSGYVLEGAKKTVGRQVSVDYFLNGALTSNEQTVGKIKTVYYQMNAELLNIETNTNDCQAFVEISKSYEKNTEY